MKAVADYTCPKCDAALRDDITDGDVVTCPDCKTEYRALLDTDSGHAALVDYTIARGAHPLFLPKGSVRALITLAISVEFWILVFADMAVPPFLFGLTLTLIAYYFGSRRRIEGSDTGVYDAAQEKEYPLFLPDRKSVV